jgi:regulator of cell morphogenesis and NO signaling
MISKQDILADVLIQNKLLLPVSNRLGISFGLGDKTIEEITNQYNIDCVFFVELCNLVLSGGKVRPKYIDRFKTDWTLKYLIKSHYLYLNEYMKSIEDFILELKSSEQDRNKDIDILLNFFNIYKIDVKEHLDFEDNYIFPYIQDLEKSYESKHIDDDLFGKIKKYSLNNYLKNHDSLYLQLNDLKNLFLKYLSPFKDETNIIKGLSIIYELEADLRTHELIENNILFSKVLKIEKILLNNYKNQSE